jgi:hypothetical protein
MCNKKTAIFFSIIGISFFFCVLANAAEYIQKYIPEVKTVGEGRMSVALWDIYEARLYAPKGQYQADRPFALSLKYLRPIKGEKIADQSIIEMRRQGRVSEIKLAKWHEQMRRIFPDVKLGTVLTGISKGDGRVIFVKDGKKIGTINDANFSRHFFDIWLGEQTREPEIKASLLGGF